MSRANAPFWLGSPGATFHLVDEALSVLIGAGITAGLFLAMARFGHGVGVKPAPVITSLHHIAEPLETPPPLPAPTTEPEPVVSTVTGLDVAAAADSPVHLAVTPPILENLPVPLAPPAKMRTSTLPAEFKPKADLNADVSRVFQPGEVDQRPSVLVNTNPFIPRTVRRNADVLRVVLLMVVDAKGVAANIRVLKTSGNAEFDAIIVKCVQDEWVFNPAIKKGRKVKCLVQRTITVKWSANASPFES